MFITSKFMIDVIAL